MVHKDRRRADLHAMLKSDPNRFAQLYHMRCVFQDGITDSERVEYPTERDQDDIARREQRFQQLLADTEKKLNDIVRDKRHRDSE